jgi:uncharacterized RDD family membrane protein YckC
MTTSLSEEQGVYYHPEDSPGFIVRLLIDAADVVVLLIIMALFILAWEELAPRRPSLGWVAAALLFFLWWLYLVPLKRSRFGTLGYAVFRIKVVNLHGQSPGLLRLTLRTLVALAFNTLVDLIYLTSDTSRQALRDKISGTYLVKRSAIPAGHGRFIYSRVFFGNYALIYREVAR